MLALSISACDTGIQPAPALTDTPLPTQTLTPTNTLEPATALTVSETWKNAEALDGTIIRVRGEAKVYTEPYVGLIGCPPAGVIENDVVVGRMVLLPEDDPHASQASGIAIAESSLLCEGSHCGLSCAPFHPGPMDYCSAPHPSASIYELVGMLRVSQVNGETRLVLENIDLAKSQRWMTETWESIPTGKFEYMCP